MGEPLSESIQHYLREIYKLHAEEGKVSVTALAKRLDVSNPSASAMVKKLAALELANHEPYRGVELTPAGERVAVEVIRHHRLLELYLAETLGLDVAAVHEEADRLEHAMSEELEARIDQRSASRPTIHTGIRSPTPTSTGRRARPPEEPPLERPRSSLRTNGLASESRPSCSRTRTSSSRTLFAASSASSSSKPSNT